MRSQVVCAGPGVAHPRGLQGHMKSMTRPSYRFGMSTLFYLDGTKVSADSGSMGSRLGPVETAKLESALKYYCEPS